jgi:predicted O-methyltransferase YrrM
MTVAELEWLHAAASKASRIAEIGSYKGRSTLALAAACPGVVYAIDVWASPPIYLDFRYNLGDYLEGKVIPVRQPSIDAGASLPGEFDLVFIDADHAYDAVMSDLCTWVPRVKRGGVVAGHDYDAFWPGVVRAVDEVFGQTVKRGAGSIWYVEI